MEMPLVSVIVPLYNAENFIGDLIGSCLVQTLENFELIIVDDCSTDKSREVVESYIPKSSGRLKLIKMFANTGGPALPRNKGLEISRGKYIFFADNDDALTYNALEQFYRIAEKYRADVLNCRRYFKTSGSDEEFAKNLELHGDPNDNKIEQVVEDTGKRLRAWMKNSFEITPWTKFCRRDFLVENEIKFPPVVQEDSVWTFELICTARRIFMIPNAVYIHRVRKDSFGSVSLKREVTSDGVRRKFERIICGLKDIDEFMGRLEFFRENPALRYRTLSHFVTQNLNWIRVAGGDTEPYVIYQNLREAFSAEMGGHDVLISFLVANNIRLIKELIAEREKNKSADSVEGGGD